ncbi:hypothetical protein [Flavobacterium solisilvae]|uniref:Uncharacterized protein n=1 Tax=Flavobacterium solisilvae TaxID=1852019 RepID=A0ABX1QRH6_9FLAO|nr:hypothetical protein [Flavobacterium solisilvae]NMH24859.1 hypothetical protein [Flavobacterium solisilvae]
MKKITLFILFFFCQSFFCQEYHFDGFLEYKDSKDDNRYHMYFYNSNDESYELWVFDRSGEIYGGITDTKKKLIHEHEVINNGDSIKFNYRCSRKWEEESNYYRTNPFYNVTKKEIDSTKTEVTILIYRNEKKKRVDSKIEIIIDNSELIANKNIIFPLVHGINLNNIFPEIRGIPTSIKIKNRYGFKTTHTLVRKEKINTILTVDNIKIKQYNK